MDLAVGEHRELGEGNGNAAGAGALFVIPGRVRERAGEFGHPVNLPHAIAGPGDEEPALDFRRTDRAAGAEEAQRGEIHAIRRHSGDGAKSCWDQRAVGDALGFDDAPEIRDDVRIAKSARRRNDHRCARAERGQARAEGAPDMKHRQRDQDPVAGVQIDREHRADRGGDDIPVA